MNAAAKVLEQAYLSTDNLWVLLFGRPSWRFIFCIALVLSSAFSVIYTRDLNRRLINEIQSQEMVRDEIHIERGKLLLEQSTWATPVRVEQIAQEKLGMQPPLANQVVLVTLKR